MGTHLWCSHAKGMLKIETFKCEWMNAKRLCVDRALHHAQTHTYKSSHAENNSNEIRFWINLRKYDGIINFGIWKMCTFCTNHSTNRQNCDLNINPMWLLILFLPLFGLSFYLSLTLIGARFYFPAQLIAAHLIPSEPFLLPLSFLSISEFRWDTLHLKFVFDRFLCFFVH